MMMMTTMMMTMVINITRITTLFSAYIELYRATSKNRNNELMSMSNIRRSEHKKLIQMFM